MIFKEFNSIIIENKKGVSPVGIDTKLMAEHAGRLNVESVLEIGTGTGFVCIYLKKLGFDCQGTDVNNLALDCANQNALRNNIEIEFYNSNLFENVNTKFDLILFNPPYGNSNSAFFSKILEIIKSLLPKENHLICNISFQLVKKSRRKLINEFLRDVDKFLNDKGRILIFLDPTELDLVKDFSFKIIDETPLRNTRLVLINRKNKEKRNYAPN